MKNKSRTLTIIFLLAFSITAYAQITVYNNFGPEHESWDYNYSMGWTVAGDSVEQQYGVEQAMAFQSTVDGTVTDIWVAFFYVPLSTMADTVIILLTQNPAGQPPDTADVMEEWTITEFEDWSQWSPPHHLQGNGVSQLQEGEDYWLWAIGTETTWTGWCMNIDPTLTCPHTLRREGENWLPIGYETASAFRVDVDTTSNNVEPSLIIPHAYTLAQNYPNPFNPTTTIEYHLTTATPIRLEIYDLLGRKVTTLVNQTQPPGNHQVTWNAGNLASGIYFYTLQTSNYKETNTMLIAK